MLDFGVSDDVLGLGLFACDELEIAGGNLQRVEKQASFLFTDLVTQDEFGYLTKSQLDGLDVFEKGKMDFVYIPVAIMSAIVESRRAEMLVKVTELLVF